MNKELLPAPQDAPKTLSGARSQLEELENRISGNSNTIDSLKKTIYTGGAKISEIGKILGVDTPFLSSKSVKDALTQVNNDFTSSFKNTAEVIGHINTNLSNTLVIIKFMIICMGQITYNQRKDKKASKKAVERLKNITEKIKKGEISVSELIDIFAENVEAEAKEYQQLEGELSQLQSEWQNTQKDLNDKLQAILHEAESLKKSHNSSIKDLNDKLSVTITDIKNKHEEASSLLKNEQKESLDKIEKHFTDYLAELKQTSDALAKSQEEFVSLCKEQTSSALSEFQKEAKYKTAEIQKQTDGFIENQNALYTKMKEQIRLYKIVSVVAISVSILSLVCNFLV